MQDLNDMLYFAEVVDRGGFAAAGRALGVPKSKLSRRVAELETRLGVRLLQRTTRKLAITDFGQGVLDHARALAGEVDAALAFALHRQARPSGRLRVSMPGDFASVVSLERHCRLRCSTSSRLSLERSQPCARSASRSVRRSPNMNASMLITT